MTSDSWLLTVFGERLNCAAISLSEQPNPTRERIANSRSVKTCSLTNVGTRLPFDKPLLQTVEDSRFRTVPIAEMPVGVIRLRVIRDSAKDCEHREEQHESCDDPARHCLSPLQPLPTGQPQ